MEAKIKQLLKSEDYGVMKRGKKYVVGNFERLLLKGL